MREPSTDKEWELISTNQFRARDRKYEVAVLPLAAIEPHNLHLPYGQDFLHTTYVARRSCEAAWQRGAEVLCLPGIPYGVDCNLMDYPLTIHVSQATLDAMIKDVVVSLRKHGIRKILLLNGHGGNDFAPLVRQMQSDTDIHIFLCNWWTVGRDKYDTIFDRPDDHAGTFETSVAMALYPELVEYDVAGDGKTRDFKFEALRQGWVKTSRDFAKLNDHCGCGDPRGASAEKGEKYLELVCERITDFLVELSQTPIDGFFPMAEDFSE
ncbi:MAG: creatininase family protein [Sedimentisphaerales bacterium]|nr:creatininase family protein [Sedimentisphaerales bacterium]